MLSTNGKWRITLANKIQMHNFSLDQYHRRIHKKIEMVGAFLEDPYLPKIIRSCRLKPITVFFNDYSPKKLLESIWVDELGAYLLNIEKKNIQVRENKIEIPKHCTDIFRHESISFLVTHSKFACVGLLPETDCFVLLLGGTDNYFRCYTHFNKSLKIASPLIIGLKLLKRCVRFKKKENKTIRIQNIKSERKEFEDIKWFIVALPRVRYFARKLKGYDTLKEIIYNGQ